MHGGTITGNYSLGDGGGVYVGSNSTFTKSDGSISMNHLLQVVSGNGTQVYYNASPPQYRNSDLGEDDDISTDDLETNWET
jgi:hypothetical protein